MQKGRRRSFGRRGSNGRDRHKKVCYNCFKLGHWAPDFHSGTLHVHNFQPQARLGIEIKQDVELDDKHKWRKGNVENREVMLNLEEIFACETMKP